MLSDVVSLINMMGLGPTDLAKLKLDIDEAKRNDIDLSVVGDLGFGLIGAAAGVLLIPGTQTATETAALAVSGALLASGVKKALANLLDGPNFRIIYEKDGNIYACRDSAAPMSPDGFPGVVMTGWRAVSSRLDSESLLVWSGEKWYKVDESMIGCAKDTISAIWGDFQNHAVKKHNGVRELIRKLVAYVKSGIFTDRGIYHILEHENRRLLSTTYELLRNYSYLYALTQCFCHSKELATIIPRDLLREILTNYLFVRRFDEKKIADITVLGYSLEQCLQSFHYDGNDGTIVVGRNALSQIRVSVKELLKDSTVDDICTKRAWAHDFLFKSGYAFDSADFKRIKLKFAFEEVK